MDLPDLTPFRAVRTLGSGGSGSVLLALDADKRIAVKTLYPEALEADNLSRFIEISKSLSKVIHPNVATVLDSGQLKNGQPYVAMEYLEGQDLTHRLAECRALPYMSVLQIAHQCCQGLAAAHAAGMLHLDLKPSNIFLCGEQVKLLDFSMARWVKNPLEGETPVTGTPEYWSPEQASGEPLDERSDLYSLGVVMFEALTGRLPFVSHSFSEVIASHLHDAPPLVVAPAGLPPIPEGVKALLLRCLEKARERRFASAKELADAIERLRRPLAPPPRPSSRPPTPPRPLTPARPLTPGRPLTPPRPLTSPRPLTPAPPQRATPSPTPAPQGTQLRGSPDSAEPVPRDDSESGVRPQGSVLGSYRLLELLGEGGMGRVYLAEHTKLGRKVAIKLLRSEYARNPNAVKRFFTEARAVNQINHEHIVEITDFIEDGDEKYCVMELLKGETLENALHTEGALPIQRVLTIALQVCKALAAVHRTGIVHRDLKPSNIFLTEMWGQRDFVKLLDFGVIKLAADAADRAACTTGVGAIVGTPEYMSPEQAAAKPIDHRSDLCSLGIVLYEMLSGRKPFAAKSYGDLLIKIMTVQPPRLKSVRQGVPRALEELVHRCMEKDPGRRPASSDELLQALEAIAIEEGAELEQFVPHQVTFVSRELPAPPRKRRLVALVALAVILGTGAVIGALALRGPTPQQAGTKSAVELSIDSSPQGAEIFGSGGRRLGVTPARLFVPRSAREETFELRLAGHESARRTVSFTRDVQLVATLQRVAAEPRPVAEPKPAAEPKRTAPAKVASPVPTPSPKPGRKAAAKKTKDQLKGDTIDPFSSQ